MVRSPLKQSSRLLSPEDAAFLRQYHPDLRRHDDEIGWPYLDVPLAAQFSAIPLWQSELIQSLIPHRPGPLLQERPLMSITRCGVTGRPPRRSRASMGH